VKDPRSSGVGLGNSWEPRLSWKLTAIKTGMVSSSKTTGGNARERERGGWKRRRVEEWELSGEVVMVEKRNASEVHGCVGSQNIAG
jgi:hypothetical protein